MSHPQGRESGKPNVGQGGRCEARRLRAGPAHPTDPRRSCEDSAAARALWEAVLHVARGAGGIERVRRVCRGRVGVRRRALHVRSHLRPQTERLFPSCFAPCLLSWRMRGPLNAIPDALYWAPMLHCRSLRNRGGKCALDRINYLRGDDPLPCLPRPLAGC